MQVERVQVIHVAERMLSIVVILYQHRPTLESDKESKGNGRIENSWNAALRSALWYVYFVIIA